MDDGSRCLLDVISDPQLLQSFLESDNGGANGANETSTSLKDNQHKTYVVQRGQLTNNSNVTNAISLTSVAVPPSLADSRQVDQVSSSGGGHVSPTSTMRPPSTSGVMSEEKPVSNTNNLVTSTSLGITTVSLANNVINSSTSIATTSTTCSPITLSLRAPSPQISLTPQSAIQLGATVPRTSPPITMLSQQLIATPSGVQQIVLAPPPRPTVGTGTQAAFPAGALAPGQFVQIIQTPTGPQIVSANPPSVSLQQPVTTVSGVSTAAAKHNNSTPVTSRSNKQILPKPPGSSSTTASSHLQLNDKSGQIQQGNPMKVVNNYQRNIHQFAPTSIATGSNSQVSPQILIGPGGGQSAGVLASAGQSGTFLLNHIIPGLGPQPILIQGNIGNGVAGSVHLTLRPQPSPLLTVNTGATTPASQPESNTTLLNALASGQQSLSVKTSTQSSQPQTIVIPNNTAVSSAQQGMVVTSGQPGMVMAAPRTSPNIILARPNPTVSLAGQSASTPSPNQQFLQISTPNGPLLVALQPSMLGAQQLTSPQQTQAVRIQQPQGIQLGNTMVPLSAATVQPGQNALANAISQQHAGIQTLLSSQNEGVNLGPQLIQQTTVPTSNALFLAQPQILAGQRPNLQQTNIVIGRQNQSKSAAPSVNLAELLKEHGILPESSPPSSPTNPQTVLPETPTITNTEASANQPPTVLMMPNLSQPNIVLTQAQTPQLRLALGPDGSVILQPHVSPITQAQVSNSKTVNESLKDTCGSSSSQPSPDSTTPTIDTAAVSTTVGTTVTTPTATTTSATTSSTTTTMSSSITQNTSSALLEQLNSAPAVKVPDVVASLALQQGVNSVSSKEEIKSSTPQASSVIPLTVQSINNTEVQPKQTIFTFPVQASDSSNTSTSNAAVIRIGNCDNLSNSVVLSTAQAIISTSANAVNTVTVVSQTNSNTTSNNSSTTSASSGALAQTLIDQNGVPMIQVSLNNQEFLQRLETQLKSLLVLKSPTPQQKEILQELLALQQTMLQARVKAQSQNSGEETKVVIATPQQTQQLQNLQQQQQQQQNVHLVNLLKQAPVNQQQPQQIRLITPSAAPVTGTATIQVGNQLITFTTPAKQQLQNLKTFVSNQTTQQKQLVTPAPAVFVKLQTPVTTSSTTMTVTTKTTSSSSSKIDSHVDKDKKNIRSLKLIQQQLNADQNAALKPDTKRAFKSPEDACKRLLRYHVFNSPTMSHSDLDKSDELFEAISVHLLHKKQQLYDKFRTLLLKQSIKETSPSEHVMLDRMFISEETSALKSDKELVADGKELILPPVPESWYQQLRSSVEEEEKLSINRKRKSSIDLDENYDEATQQKRCEEAEEDSDEETEDDDDDSEDEENDKEALASYLGNGNLTSDYYDSGNFDQNLEMHSQMNGSSVPLSNFDPNSTSDLVNSIYDEIPDDSSNDWTNSILNNSAVNSVNSVSSVASNLRRLTWNTRYQETEAAVAVESILSGAGEETDIPVDLCEIDGLDGTLEDEEEEDEEDEDDEEEEDEVNGFSEDPAGQHSDVQMQCAIKSILDVPVQQHHNSAYYNNQISSHMNDFRYGLPSHLRHQNRHPGYQRDYSLGNGVNDPVLEEAVKSILSQ